VRTAVETNVIGMMRVTNTMLRLLHRSAHPRIVNQSSHVGSLTLQTAPDVELGEVSGAYAPTKTYLNAVAIQYAKELSGTGILINNACPRLRGDRAHRLSRVPHPKARCSDRHPAGGPARRRPERAAVRRRRSRPVVIVHRAG
jgi:NAD(P)-dependent dehydrogenase (short-subunit alcohol dehydrogenase family)